MPFKYRCLTANCGNDFMGELTTRAIISQLLEDDADIYILNCQEARINKVFGSIRESLPASAYRLMSLGSMKTVTKMNTIFGDTGIASYIIYKNNITIRREPLKIARRMNKGGVISTVMATRDYESIALQVISGHLDSFDAATQNRDWLNIRKTMATIGVTDWNALVDTIPHLCIMGYDANTRMRRVAGPDSKPINPWLTDTTDPVEAVAAEADNNLLGIKKTLFANQFSSDVTYEKHSDVVRSNKRARAGYVDRGMLDLNGIGDGSSARDYVTTKGVITYDLEEGCARDHRIVASPLCSYNIAPPFDKVKGQISLCLAHAAPLLSLQLSQLGDTVENRAFLVTVYNDLLSQQGLLNIILNLHIAELRQPSLNRNWFDLLNGIDTSNYQQSIQHISAQVSQSWGNRFRQAFNLRNDNNNEIAGQSAPPSPAATARLERQDSWEVGAHSGIDMPIQTTSKSAAEDNIEAFLYSQRSLRNHELMLDDPGLAGEQEALVFWLEKFLRKNKGLNKESPLFSSINALSDSVKELLNPLSTAESSVTPEQWAVLYQHETISTILSSLSPTLKMELNSPESLSESDEESASDRNDLFAQKKRASLARGDSLHEYGSAASTDYKTVLSKIKKSSMPPSELSHQDLEANKKRLLIALGTRRAKINANDELVAAVDALIKILKLPEQVRAQEDASLTTEQWSLLHEDDKINALIVKFGSLIDSVSKSDGLVNNQLAARDDSIQESSTSYKAELSNIKKSSGIPSSELSQQDLEANNKPRLLLALATRRETIRSNDELVAAVNALITILKLPEQARAQEGASLTTEQWSLLNQDTKTSALIEKYSELIKYVCQSDPILRK